MFPDEVLDQFDTWINHERGWNMFARDYLGVTLDEEQDEALYAIRHHSKVSIASGTSRGKDYLIAVAACCFLYLTPEWDEKGKLVSNTKVALTGPTARQVKDIMRPEISRIFRGAPYLPGYLTGNDIRFEEYDEWFLTGFKADDTNTEAWAGFHAANVFFGVTEATGLPQKVYDAIEGNLQGNSRLVLVFNPNINHGYAASSFKSPEFKKIRLNSLNAPNVRAKKIIHPGQVDYEWVAGRLSAWCLPIHKSEYRAEEGDFEFEGQWYRPNDEFRKKILGLFPKVSEGVLVPPEWVDLAVERWKEQQRQGWKITKPLRLGVDVAGMGRDNTCFCPRYGDYVKDFKVIQGGGTANHMEVAGNILIELKKETDTFTGRYAQAFIDTIGEGGGVYSRTVELGEEKDTAWIKNKTHSCKFSEAATDAGGIPLKDAGDVYEFLNMRAWSFWAIRDWLDPRQGSKAMLPEDDYLKQELTETQWKFTSKGLIQIESKEDIKKRLKRSPDRSDALANTFWPVPDVTVQKAKRRNIGSMFT